MMLKVKDQKDFQILKKKHSQVSKNPSWVQIQVLDHKEAIHLPSSLGWVATALGNLEAWELKTGILGAWWMPKGASCC